MAGRGAGDGLVQYAGGKLSQNRESLTRKICLEEAVQETVSSKQILSRRDSHNLLLSLPPAYCTSPSPAPPASHLLPRSLLSHCLATAKIKKAGQRIVLQMRLFVGKADITLMDGDVKRNLL